MITIKLSATDTDFIIDSYGNVREDIVDMIQLVAKRVCAIPLDQKQQEKIVRASDGTLAEAWIEAKKEV